MREGSKTPGLRIVGGTAYGVCTEPPRNNDVTGSEQEPVRDTRPTLADVGVELSTTAKNGKFARNARRLHEWPRRQHGIGGCN
jgi:hypothetical protein